MQLLVEQGLPGRIEQIESELASTLERVRSLKARSDDEPER
ncbi:MAG TPA: hypothetical protein VGI72_01635 [Gaiellales bacterium]